ncbi:MAG: glycoside hydrolase family 16 protein [Alloprevotella sp.]|nr:glycoside hydrolase family 16 protein [Alloprevotella sp.]
MKRYILGALLSTLAATQTSKAQTISFDTEDYKAVSVYDTWEKSPFRTGELQGNAAVVDNHLTEPDAVLGVAPNASPKIVGIQRSRFGSNTFGVRIDLKETFELPTATRFVHVLIHKPTTGRVMLIGLGKRQERAGQSPEAEQFWEMSTTKVEAGKWCDAVFPIKGSAGIDIYSLVVVPDCESPHGLTEDFIAYIDDIELNADGSTRIQREEYPVNFDRDQKYTRTDRGLRAIKLQAQSVTVASSITKDLNVYQDLTEKQFQAKAGQTVSPTFTYTGTWMSGYVYVDYGMDGKFSNVINDDGTPAEGCDLVAYSFYENKNSAGKSVANGNILNPPSFTVPASTPYGFYRMRYKVDWNSIDPGGCPGPDNQIVDNGGAIVDIRLNVHGDEVNINDANRNGEVLTADGEKLSGYKAPFGKAFAIKVVPERGFGYSGVRIRHGHNLAGDSLVHGTAQYSDTIIARSRFDEENVFIIPPALVDGDLQIEGLFVEENPKYPVGFDKTTDRSGSIYQNRKITSIGLDAQKATPDNTDLMYHDLTRRVLVAKAGAQVTPTLGFTDTWMDSYIYIDKNRNGYFEVEEPGEMGALTEENELVSFSGLTLSDGTLYNSAGKELRNLSDPTPQPFTMPAGMAPGFYMMRYKVDWDNLNPAGRVGDDDNIIRNGGGIADVRLYIYEEGNASVKASAAHGTLRTADGQELDGLSTPLGEPLDIVADCEDGYRLAGLTIRHGDLAAKDSLVDGVAQYATDYLDLTNAYGPNYTIPAGFFDGTVEIEAVYAEATPDDYVLVFSDEFNQPDGSQPNPEYWSSSARRNAAWNRYIKDDPSVVYIEDGALVCRAIKNTDATDDVPMITGARETKDKFSFTYGIVEVRLKTTRHTGNFPAAWMMPQPPAAGWPNAGEIDIFETIDNQNRAWHTVHTNWTYNMGNTQNSSANEWMDVENWHVYGLNWTENEIQWTVDGELVAHYEKSDNAYALESGQWPFDHPFYIILNQSVGMGTWAANPDVDFTYETRFDYVRVYQKRDTGINDVTNSFHNAADGIAYDLQGRRVDAGSRKGIYIIGGKKVIRR